MGLGDVRRKKPVQGNGYASSKAPTLLSVAVTNAAAKSQLPAPANLVNQLANLNVQAVGTDITVDETQLNAQTPAKPFTAASFKIGDIVKIPHLVPSLDAKGRAAERIECEVIDGFICPKVRLAVVVNVYLTRMIVLPLYSCNKQGVTRKDDDYKLTAMSIWNPSDVSATSKSLLTPDYLVTNPGRNFYPGSHINLTDTVSVSYNWKIVAKQGSLREQSRSALMRRFRIVQEAAYFANPRQYIIDKFNADRASIRRQIGTMVPPSTGAPSAVGTNRTAGSWAKVTSMKGK